MGVTAAAIAGGVALFGMAASDMASSAAAQNSNAQTEEQWLQGEMQKALNNGKEMFKAVYQTQQQSERNRAVQQAAYLFRSDSLAAAKEQHNHVQRQLSASLRDKRGALINTMASQGMKGGTSKALKLSQSLNFLRESMDISKNFETAKKNINRETQNMMAQQTANLFIPNTQGPSIKPKKAKEGGMLGGLTSMDPILGMLMG